ncbi:ankyrin-1-like [Trichogramma pretiosum]|uniref:ankyrin-1-like n=1 Tax=Trichogramma pretiosum TaxID=7493 RepID=UPI000C71913C|nr:ankyrin-1-like [Trichogramma pretiosum]
MLGRRNVVEKFLQLGQDPNIRVPETGNSPLHLAVYRGYKETFELLLRNGANLNSANMDGSTPLHMICEKKHRFDLLENLFKISNDRHQPVQVDARNNLGRTPLQLAVANLLPHVVDVLLQHGADLSNFSFPNESYFARNVDSQLDDNFFKLELASGALASVERLEERGYQLDQNDALTIMKFFAKYELFESADLDKRWYDNEEFARLAKNKTIRHNLSLYNLIQLRPKEEDKLLSYLDYFRFAQSNSALH